MSNSLLAPASDWIGIGVGSSDWIGIQIGSDPPSLVERVKSKTLEKVQFPEVLLVHLTLNKCIFTFLNLLIYHSSCLYEPYRQFWFLRVLLLAQK
ncbi:hypothetical protein L596_016829 [Steinernema carpocapsae]|uniref:Uncharacterized protein n=1 Tax=Steinernema carpocapsae TaxID=34508 RepID=A0A4U5NKL1_STECR|nr:hypothetical protein L596_016829 [Steinernema carpocapsae]